MSPFMEIQGKNLDKAIEKACSKLKISKDSLKYEVISYGSSGIFGLAGIKKARIRVAIPESATPVDSAPVDPAPHSKKEIKNDVQPTTQETLDENRRHRFPDDPLDLGKNVLQRIVDSITSDAEIRANQNTNRLSFDVVGGNSALLIGKHGQTLEAIQSIVEKIINKHNQHRIRVEVDVEGYLENRRHNLERQAARLAEKCKRIGKPVAVGQMNAHDRRIVHLALKEDRAVRTQSIGEGYMRKLMIYPKKQSGNRGKTP